MPVRTKTEVALRIILQEDEGSLTHHRARWVEGAKDSREGNDVDDARCGEQAKPNECDYAEKSAVFMENTVRYVLGAKMNAMNDVPQN